MVVAAVGLAGGVAVAAIGDALRAPFCAEEVGKGLAVFGEVGTLAVAADAGVGEGVRVTGVLLGFGAVSGGLGADAGGGLSVCDVLGMVECGITNSGHWDFSCWHQYALVALETVFGSMV